MNSKPFKHFDTLETFNSKKISAISDNTSYYDNNIMVVGSPDILWNDICFIEDTKLIWTHGEFYAESTANLDLSAYITKEYLSNQGYLTNVPNTYPTYTDIEAMGYSTTTSVHTILEAYVTQDILSSNAYAGYSYVYDSYAYVLDLIENNDYVTSYALTYLNDRLDEFESISNLANWDLNSYAKKSDLNSYAKKSDLNTYVKKDDLTAQSYVTTTVLSNQGYLTSHQDLSTYVSKVELSSQSYAGYAYIYSAYSYILDKLDESYQYLQNSNFITAQAFAEVEDKLQNVEIDIDDELSNISTNPVENATITTYLDDISYVTSYAISEIDSRVSDIETCLNNINTLLNSIINAS